MHPALSEIPITYLGEWGRNYSRAGIGQWDFSYAMEEELKICMCPLCESWSDTGENLDEYRDNVY